MTSESKDMSSLLGQLEGLSLDWNLISVEYTGDQPQPAYSLDEWDELTELVAIMQRPLGESISCDFVRAYHQVVGLTRQFVFSRLVPWSCEIAPLLIDGSCVENIPSPPANALPPAAGFPISALEEIAGTPDVVAAGKRFIFWCAAYSNPAQYQRGEEHRVQFFSWAGKLIERNQERCWACRDVFRAISATCKVSSAFTQVPVKQEPQQPNYELCKIGKKKFNVRFAGEAGGVSGEGAVRVCHLLRYKRCEVRYLFDPTVGIAGHHRSTVDYSMASIEQDHPQVPVSRARQEKLSEEDRKQIESELSENEAILEVTTDPETRARLSKTQAIARNYLNSNRRGELSIEDSQRSAVQKSIKRFLDDLRKYMPEFAKHLDESMIFDNAQSTYFYRPKNDITWNCINWG